MHSIRLVARLTRLRIAVLSGVTAATAGVVAAPGVTPAALDACLAVLLLAMGASALNQLQEREIDARMRRTRTRPLPTASVRPSAVLALAAVLLGAGLAWLLVRHGAVPALLGAGTVAVYNGVYTPLKRRTAFAAAPGGLVGLGAPLIGWVAAGGSLGDPRLPALVFFFYVWQVPHFWLLLLRQGEDQYAGAGLPSAARRLGPEGLGRVTFAWLAATAGAGPLLALFGLTHAAWTAPALLLGGVGLAAESRRLLGASSAGSAGRLFRVVNAYVCAVMTLLVVDALA